MRNVMNTCKLRNEMPPKDPELHDGVFIDPHFHNLFNAPPPPLKDDNSNTPHQTQGLEGEVQDC